VYQQFQMIQTLRRDEFMAATPPVVHNSLVYSMDNPPPNYDDLVREKQAREDHIQQYTGDLNGLYARYQTLQEDKKALLACLQELTQPKRLRRVYHMAELPLNESNLLECAGNAQSYLYLPSSRVRRSPDGSEHVTTT
jgi:hypothetical protein